MDFRLRLPSIIDTFPQANQFICPYSPTHSEEEQLVWSKMLQGILQSFHVYGDVIYPPFKEGFYSLSLEEHHIPDIVTINSKLAPIGWQAVFVTGFVPAKLYALLLSHQIFPVSSALRPLKYFHYSAAPDFAHDILGHLPMLFVKEFRDLLQKWAHISANAPATPLDAKTYELTADLIKEKEKDHPNAFKIQKLTNDLAMVYDKLNANPSILSILAKFYGWSFEFGAIKVKEDIHIFGAAILSSALETKNICEGQVQSLPFTQKTLQTGVNYTDLQQTIFYTNSFSEYEKILENIPHE